MNFIGGSASFVAYHPYILGFQATKVPVANSDTLRCGTIREVKYDLGLQIDFKLKYLFLSGLCFQ